MLRKTTTHFEQVPLKTLMNIIEMELPLQTNPQTLPVIRKENREESRSAIKPGHGRGGKS
jgi:hypothetical protein